MSAFAIGILAAVLVGTGKGVVTWLVTGEVKGITRTFLTRWVERAAARLPEELRLDQMREWLDELKELDDRPLRGWLYVHGLASACRQISGAACGRGSPWTMDRMPAARVCSRALRWLAGADDDVLAVAPSDRARLTGVGSVVAYTALCSALMTYIATPGFGFSQALQVISASTCAVTIVALYRRALRATAAFGAPAADSLSVPRRIVQRLCQKPSRGPLTFVLFAAVATGIACATSWLCVRADLGPYGVAGAAGTTIQRPDGTLLLTCLVMTTAMFTSTAPLPFIFKRVERAAAYDRIAAYEASKGGDPGESRGRA